MHDIGHLAGPSRQEDMGVVHHDRAGAAFLKKRGFPIKVVELVASNVQAKRYLITANPDYARLLSPSSMRTPLAEAGAFERDPLFETKLRLRAWDEQAKRPGWNVPHLEAYRSLLIRSVHCASAAKAS